MKRIMILMASLMAFSAIARADDRPVTFNQLPKAAQTFINDNYSGEKISFVTVDDDFIRPEYQVVMANGVMLEFDNGGRLEKIESRNGDIPSGIIPVQIMEIVKGHYPDADVVEYEVGRKTYEVKLSNRMELKFNSHFNVVEIDD